jgi:hypothetical protein
MQRRLLAGCCAMLAACGGGQAGGNPADSAAAAAVDTTPDGMPVFPEASPGQFALNATPRTDLTSVWRARAGLCERPPFLQVQGNVPGFGALLALSIPLDPAGRVAKYPIVYTDSGIPAPPAALLAVQRVTDKGVFQFQAREGEVDVYAFGRNVSGRISVTLREIATEEPVNVTGVFNAVPVELQSAEYCDKLAEAAAQR